MQNKALYIAAGILIGIVAVFVLGKISLQDVYAAPAGKQSETFANQDYIAIASISKNDNNILWLIDTRSKKLLLYEYYADQAIRLKCVRDVQYDISIPDGVAIPDKNAEPSPNNVKKLYEELRKNADKMDGK
jgi:hypothetical protein